MKSAQLQLNLGVACRFIFSYTKSYITFHNEFIKFEKACEFMLNLHRLLVYIRFHLQEMCTTPVPVLLSLSHTRLNIFGIWFEIFVRLTFCAFIVWLHQVVYLYSHFSLSFESFFCFSQTRNKPTTNLVLWSFFE